MTKKEICLIVFLVLVVNILHVIFAIGMEIFCMILGTAILLASVFTIMYLVSTQIMKKLRMKKVSVEGQIKIDNYYTLEKDNFLLSENNLILYFEEIDFVITDFYDMKKRLFITKEMLFDSEIENIIRGINNNEIT